MITSYDVLWRDYSIPSSINKKVPKGVIRRRQSKKHRKQNGQKREGISTMDDLQYKTQKTKVRATRTPLKTNHCNIHIYF